ncbi:MAG: HAD family phosphatase [Clostridia bacterium]|nr:HAD family phosphatase [Clostridia bacterium]
MEIKNFKGAIFDLDGTLLDSMHIWHDVDVEFFRRRNLPLTRDYIDVIKNMHLPAAAVYTKEKYNIKESEEEIVKEWLDLCAQAYISDVDLKEGVFEYLKSLHDKGIKMAFATASEKVVCEETLKKHKIFDFFTDFAYVSEINIGKTEPDIYLLAAERIGVEPQECIVFEDIIEGIRSAKKGGFITCGVYDKSSAKDTVEIKKTANYYINSFKELF